MELIAVDTHVTIHFIKVPKDWEDEAEGNNGYICGLFQNKDSAGITIFEENTGVNLFIPYSNIAVVEWF